jgi:hypothetical protein
MFSSIKLYAKSNPLFHAYWLCSAINIAYPFYEFGIVGENFLIERKKISKKFLPNIILFGGNNVSKLDLLANRCLPGKTLFYVCEKRVCTLPVEDSDKAIEQILS